MDKGSKKTVVLHQWEVETNVWFYQQIELIHFNEGDAQTISTHANLFTMAKIPYQLSKN